MVAPLASQGRGVSCGASSDAALPLDKTGTPLPGLFMTGR
jgi:hypothetical protein